MECAKYVFSLITFLFYINASQEAQPLVIIRDLNLGHTVMGQTIRLECRTTFASNCVSIKWFSEGVLVNPDFIKTEAMSNETSDYITVSRLTIPAAQLHHRALYTCQAVHNERPDFEFTAKLALFVWDSPEITFGPVDKFPNAALELGLYIRAHPKISSLTWIHNGNETVILNPHSEFENASPNGNYYLRFPFKTLTPEDFGPYSVVAKNQFDTETLTFSVDLTNETIINLGFDQTLGLFKCEVVSFPKKVVTWIFKNFNAYDENFFLVDLVKNGTRLLASKVEENGLKVTSYVSVKNETGLLECHAGSFSKALHVLFVQNGFQIFSKNLDGVVHAVYRKPTNLICVSSSSKYTSRLTWYHDNKVGDTSQTTYINTYVAATVIRFSANGEKNFTCEALSRTGNLESRTVKVLPKKISSLYPRVSMEDTKMGHTIEGEPLELTCKIVSYEKLEVEWHFLNGTWQALDPVENLEEESDLVDSYEYVTTTRYTTVATLSRTGLYRCRTKTAMRTFWERIWVPVYNVNDSIIKFDRKASVFDRTRKEIRIFLNAHPKPAIQWFDNNGEVIAPSLISTKYVSNIDHNNYVSILTFQEMSLGNNGTYTVVTRNETFSITVNLTGIPTAVVEVDELDEGNMTGTIKCTSIGQPAPEIRWYFQKCLTLEACLTVNKKSPNDFEEMKMLSQENRGLETISHIFVNLSTPGVFRCLGRNSLGENYTDELIFYVDRLEISAKNTILRNSVKTIEIIDGEQIKIMCAASIRHYVDEMEWNLGDRIIARSLDSGYNRRDHKSLLSFISILDLAPTWDFQQYTCNALTKNGSFQSRMVQVETKYKDILIVHKTNVVNKSSEVDIGGKWKFECIAEGFPTPVVKWLKNNITVSESAKVRISNGDQELDIDDIDLTDEAEYACQVSNRISMLTSKQKLTIRRTVSWMYAAAHVALVAVVVLVLFFLNIKRKLALRVELEAAGLAHFEKGKLENLNPDLGIEDQADLLPYDKKWEVPFSKIRLGLKKRLPFTLPLTANILVNELGSGAFGVVYKARVIDFFPEEKVKIVAIKTSKFTSGFESVKELAAELKIMAHLGKHVNIVNLLGACTKNIIKNQLYVIVEYCQFGNLQDYLRKHRKNFVDQKNYESDEFDWTIGADNGSMCSKDFLIWAFQVCRGMEYLRSRRIVHGDLAARNILLADDNVVKVSDFGLSKKMYQYSNYVKKEKGLLPVKWMAIESLEKGIYSVQSDVWSFGVVLWEFFSLGESPYPELKFDEHFYKNLVEGYRMESPKAATAPIYRIMLDCWKSDPPLRPSFIILAEKIGSMLDESIKNCYVEMNYGYAMINNFAKDQDYLTMVHSPTFENVAGQ